MIPEPCERIEEKRIVELRKRTVAGIDDKAHKVNKR